MITVIFTQDQIQALQDGRLSAWREAVEDSHLYENISFHPFIGVWLGEVKDEHVEHIKQTGKQADIIDPPYQIGEEVAVIEEQEGVYNNARRFTLNTKFWIKKNKIREVGYSDWHDDFFEGKRYISQRKLKVTGVKVQKLGEINIEDAVAERGIKDYQGYEYMCNWNTNNPEHPYSPDLWTFVYEFERLEA